MNKSLATATPAQLTAARAYAATPNRACADQALDPSFGFGSHVTHADKLEYQKKNIQRAIEIENGLHDHNFTVWQRMNYHHTGECVAFLPK